MDEKIFFSLIHLLLITTTMHLQAQHNRQLPRGGAGVTISIADGAANTHTVTNGLYEYNPVQSAQSSSGDYSGGKKVTVKFPADREIRFRNLVHKAETDKKYHIAERVKGSWAVLILGRERKSTQFILPPGNPYSQQMDAILNSLRPKEDTGILHEFTAAYTKNPFVDNIIRTGVPEEGAISFKVAVINTTRSAIPDLGPGNRSRYLKLLINDSVFHSLAFFDGMEKTGNRIIAKGNREEFNIWMTQADMKKVYGNEFTVQWQYQDVVSVKIKIKLVPFEQTSIQ